MCTRRKQVRTDTRTVCSGAKHVCTATKRGCTHRKRVRMLARARCALARNTSALARNTSALARNASALARNAVALPTEMAISLSRPSAWKKTPRLQKRFYHAHTAQHKRKDCDIPGAGTPCKKAACACRTSLKTLILVLNVGLELGVISPTLFTMVVLMAFVTTIATTPILRVLIREVVL